MTEFDMDRWDELIATAGRSRAVRFDPSAPGGVRALTPEEDAALIDAIRLPDQRHTDDREHLTRELAEAERLGDHDARDTAAAHLEALDDEHDRDQRADPRIPSREDLDATFDRLIHDGCTEEEARAFEYLDARRDLADERAQAEQAMDRSWVDEIDAQQDALNGEYLGASDPETNNGEPMKATDPATHRNNDAQEAADLAARFRTSPDLQRWGARGLPVLADDLDELAARRRDERENPQLDDDQERE